jgi:WD40 repeat protein
MPFVKAEQSEGKARGSIFLWEAISGERTQSIPVALDEPSLLSWSPDGKHLAVAGDALIRIVSPETGQETAVLRGHDDKVTSLAWSPDNEYWSP